MLKLKEEFRNLPLKKPLRIKDDKGRDVLLQMSKANGVFEVRRAYACFEDPLELKPSKNDLLCHISINENSEVNDIFGSVMVQNNYITDHDSGGNIFSIPRRHLNANEEQNMGEVPSFIVLKTPSLLSRLEFLEQTFISDVYAYLIDCPEPVKSNFGILELLDMEKSDEELKQIIVNEFSQGLIPEQKKFLGDYIDVQSEIIGNQFVVAVMIYPQVAELIPNTDVGFFEYFMGNHLQESFKFDISAGTAEFHLANPFISEAILSIYPRHSTS